jgi:hypothetical protein
MENQPIPRIINAERLGGDLVIAFEDGKSAIYPAAMLYAIFPQATQLDELTLPSELE